MPRGWFNVDKGQRLSFVRYQEIGALGHLRCTCKRGRTLSCSAAPPYTASLPAQKKQVEDVEKRGGAEGLAAALHTDLRAGLPPDAKGERGLNVRRAAYGANRFKEVRPRPFLRLLLGNLRDPTLILLMVAAAVRQPLMVESRRQSYHPTPAGQLYSSWPSLDCQYVATHGMPGIV